MSTEVVGHDRSIEVIVPGRAAGLRRRGAAGTGRPRRARHRAVIAALRQRARRVLAQALIEQVPRDHQQSDTAFRYRRVVAIATLVVGTTLLGISLAIRPGDSAFYYLTMAVALTWVVGGLLSGPLHLGYLPERGRLRRPVLTPLITGLLAAGVFVIGALVLREIGPLRHAVQNILDHARYGSTALITLVTLTNGVAEEIYFRGGLFAAIGRRNPVVVSTLIYTAATLVSGNPVLVFAALTLGFVLGLQRRASGGIMASVITHITWSSVMLFGLPPLFR
jgi:membrane protease YdiL (CAAX protease family)